MVAFGRHLLLAAVPPAGAPPESGSVASPPPCVDVAQVAPSYQTLTDVCFGPGGMLAVATSAGAVELRDGLSGSLTSICFDHRAVSSVAWTSDACIAALLDGGEELVALQFTPAGGAGACPPDAAAPPPPHAPPPPTPQAAPSAASVAGSFGGAKLAVTQRISFDGGFPCTRLLYDPSPGLLLLPCAVRGDDRVLALPFRQPPDSEMPPRFAGASLFCAPGGVLSAALGGPQHVHLLDGTTPGWAAGGEGDGASFGRGDGGESGGHDHHAQADANGEGIVPSHSGDTTMGVALFAISPEAVSGLWLPVSRSSLAAADEAVSCDAPPPPPPAEEAAAVAASEAAAAATPAQPPTPPPSRQQQEGEEEERAAALLRGGEGGASGAHAAPPHPHLPGHAASSASAVALVSAEALESMASRLEAAVVARVEAKLEAAAAEAARRDAVAAKRADSAASRLEAVIGRAVEAAVGKAVEGAVAKAMASATAGVGKAMATSAKAAVTGSLVPATERAIRSMMAQFDAAMHAAVAEAAAGAAAAAAAASAAAGSAAAAAPGGAAASPAPASRGGRASAFPPPPPPPPR